MIERWWTEFVVLYIWQSNAGDTIIIYSLSRHTRKLPGNGISMIHWTNQNRQILIYCSFCRNGELHNRNKKWMISSTVTDVWLKSILVCSSFPYFDSMILWRIHRTEHSHLLPSTAPCCRSIFVSERLLLRTATSNAENPSVFKLKKKQCNFQLLTIALPISRRWCPYLFISTSVDSNIVRAFSKWPFSTAENNAENRQTKLLPNWWELRVQNKFIRY